MVNKTFYLASAISIIAIQREQAETFQWSVIILYVYYQDGGAMKNEDFKKSMYEDLIEVKSAINNM